MPDDQRGDMPDDRNPTQTTAIPATPESNGSPGHQDLGSSRSRPRGVVARPIQPLVGGGTPKDPALQHAIEAAQAENAIVFNKQALDFIARIGDDDGRASKQRRWTMIILVFLLTGGTAALLLAVLLINQPAEKITAVLASAGVLIATLAVVGLANPLQTIERDVVVRRWSDVILSTFYLQAGSWDVRVNAEYRRTAARASKDFAAMSLALGAAHGKTLDALVAIATQPAKAEEEEETVALTLANPGDQASTVNVAIDDITVQGTGPETLTYTIDGNPPGITIDADAGVISGTPTTAGEYETTVTLTSSETKESHAVTFAWKVK